MFREIRCAVISQYKNWMENFAVLKRIKFYNRTKNRCKQK